MLASGKMDMIQGEGDDDDDDDMTDEGRLRL